MTLEKSADTNLYRNADQGCRGILVVNLGSPESPNIAAVRRYLNEFLMDPHVLAMPWVLRRLLVSAIIITRPRRTARAYQRIWNDDGSPLVSLTSSVADGIRRESGLPVAMAMRYGTPRIEAAINALGNVDEIVLMALYPQHADSTRTTTIEKVASAFSGKRLLVLPPYYNHPDFLRVFGTHVKKHLPESAEHLLFSYHGLPERHLTNADPTKNHCLKTGSCCDTRSIAHATCYRHQCFSTTRAIGASLGIDHSLSFQSRLGPGKWLQPATNQHAVEMARHGVRHLAVVCPAFAVDNLETLEEIGQQLSARFHKAGGKELTLIPALNETPEWIRVLSEWANGPTDTFQEVSR
ncbi:MAG: ferrochelatase [Pseudomonadales bacterium]